MLYSPQSQLEGALRKDGDLQSIYLVKLSHLSTLCQRVLGYVDYIGTLVAFGQGNM
jgi:hypothetical protein